MDRSDFELGRDFCAAQGAPLYLGLLQFSTASGGNPTGIYVTEIASPANGANDFTLTVPSGPYYAVMGILDQNNTGGFGAGAITNVIVTC